MFVVCILRSSNRVIYVRITTSSAEACGPGAVWSLVDSSRVSHRRLRPHSTVQSSPCLLSLVSCFFLPCCSLPCVFLFFALVFPLLSLLLLHRVCRVFRLARGGVSLSLSLLSCSCLFSSCLWSCCCPVRSKSCIRSPLLTLCPSMSPSLLPPNVARILPCQSWLVHVCSVLQRGVGCGGVVGGADGSSFGSSVSCSACCSLLVP